MWPRTAVGLALALGAASLGCDGSSDTAASGSAATTSPSSRPPPPAAIAEVADARAAVADLPVAGDEAAALAAVSARPAWRGVLDRAALLARRGGEGVLYGRLGRTEDGDLALIDDEVGRGALAVRLELPAGVELADGQRLVAWGAFVPDGRRWRWQASRVARLAGAAPAASAPPPARSVLPPDDAAPADAMTPSALAAATAANLRRRTREVPLRFVVLARPLRHGDGWPVGDEPGGEVTAWVTLPGEEPIYGGLDYLADEERWSVPLGVPLIATAAVPMKLRKIGGDGPPFFELRDRPRRSPTPVPTPSPNPNPNSNPSLRPSPNPRPPPRPPPRPNRRPNPSPSPSER